MKPLHRSVALTLFALVCGACLAVGCAQILGIDDLPDGCDTDEECRADAPICGEDNKCRGCEGNDECDDSTAPICGASGQCISGCTDSTECSDATPYCNDLSGVCEACEVPRDDALCNARDEDKPYCGPAGECVACLDNTQCTTAEAPICGDDNACRACQEHDECGSSACDRGTGACVAESAVAYVVSGGTGDCTRAAPCGTIAGALELVRANNEARYVVRLDDGTYTEQVTLGNGDITVRIIGNGATVQLDSATPDRPVVTVNVLGNESIDVTLEGLIVKGANGGPAAAGIYCAGNEASRLEVIRSIVTANTNEGIVAYDCSLTVTRSAITNNPGGGIMAIDSAFDITNTYIVDNGDVRTSLGGVYINNIRTVAPQRFAFNTVADNEASAGADAGGVYCETSLTSDANATSNVIMEGFGGRPAVGGDCTWVYSNIEGKDGIPGTIAADATNIDANCMLTDRPDGLQAIEATSACANAGQDDTGILVDYDGAARPATDPDMGADVL
jgi:hypothetical protein